MGKTISLDPVLVGAQFDFFEDDITKFLHLSAGYGFGKTRVLIYKLLKLSMMNAPHPGGLVVPSYPDFSRDVKIAIDDVCNEHNIPYDFHGSEHRYTFPWSKGCLYVTTAEKKIRGPNWAYAGVNELTLITMERYREVIGRVRIKDARMPQVVSSGTPEGLSSAYYEAFVEKPMPNSKCLYGDTRDNAHNLNPNYIQSLKDTYPDALLDSYMKGLWVNLTGNRFYYSYDTKINCEQNTPDDSLPFIVGMDFNVDPLTCSIWQQWGNRMIGFDEIVLEGGEGFKTENMVKALNARGYTKKNTVICPDPAGKNRNTSGRTDVEILEGFGYTVHVKASAPRFRERQINMNKLFEQKRIVVDHIKMPKTHKDFMAVECDPITLEKVKKNPKLTHLSDGVDYMIDVHFPFNDHRSRNNVVKVR